MTQNKEDYLRLQSLRVSALYNNAATPVVVMLCGALGLVITLWNENNSTSIISWFIALVAITLVRCAIVWKYHQKEQKPETYPYWLNIYFIGTLFSGMAWGSTAFLLPSDFNILELGLIAMFMLVVISGSIGIYSVFKRIYYALSLPSILPFIILLFLQNDKQMHDLCIITTLFTFFIFIIHYHAQRITNQLLQVKYDNKLLLENYEKDQDRINILERLYITRTDQLEKAQFELSYLKKK